MRAYCDAFCSKSAKCQLHTDILLLDYIYKTNKFGIPPLNVACAGCFFSIAFRFLDQEVEENYNESVQSNLCDPYLTLKSGLLLLLLIANRCSLSIYSCEARPLLPAYIKVCNN
jgi:hypothetical protein